MKIEHDTTHPGKGGFTLGYETHVVHDPYPAGTTVVHLLLQRGGTTVDFTVDEAKAAVALHTAAIERVSNNPRFLRNGPDR